MAETPPKDPPKTDWEEEFFKTHGITEDGEKKAIKGRATVLAYDRARQKAEADAAAAKEPPKSKRWFDSK